MNKFSIHRRSNGEFQFKLIGSNGQVILVSEGYTTRKACEKGIESVILHAQDESNFVRMTASNGQYYFNLKAANGKIIATSAFFASEAGRESGIYAAKINAASSPIQLG